jgi:hypothetical protein
MSGHYTLGAKDKNWPARVAFLKLMWTLGRAGLQRPCRSHVTTQLQFRAEDGGR